MSTKLKAVLAAAAMLVTLPASAQPPPVGWTGTYAVPSILCDTHQQLQSIVEAFGQGIDAGADRFVELYRSVNAKREPTCAVTAVGGVLTKDAVELGRVSFGGTELYGWSVHVASGTSSGYYLYLESIRKALKHTI